MKRFLSLFLLTASAALGAGAQTLDLQSRAQIHRHDLLGAMPANSPEARVLYGLMTNPDLREGSEQAFARLAASPAAPRTSTLAFLTLRPGTTADDLRERGIDVLMVKGDIALIEVAYADAEAISASEGVRSMSLQRPLSTRMDVARAEQGVDQAHAGITDADGTVHTYTGRNVVTGIVDQGVDPHHINFRYANGEYRISYLAHLRYNKAGNGMAEDHYNYQTLHTFTTDAPNGYHGTHTMGIMAGSYNGPVTVANPWQNPGVPEQPTYRTEECKFYGVAPQADLAVSCGDLADGFVAYGMQYILDYAEYAQRPLVYNLSLGSNAGPHDPNSTMARFLNLMGQEAIICISAGNEGDLKIGLNKTFAEGDTTFKTFIYPFAYKYDPAVPNSQTIRYGSVSLYSNDSTPFQFRAVLYNKKRNYRAALNMPVVGDGIGTYYCSSEDYRVAETDVVGDPTFVKAYQGYVGVGAMRDEETGRYYAMIDYYVINAASNLSEDYMLGFEVVGRPGQRIDCYGDGMTTWMDSYGVAGFTDGSCNGSISDMAVAPNLIVVGSYNTRNSWLCLDGGTSRYDGAGFMPGYVSGFSSFGTLPDGRNLPTVCAPGSAIISSVSWPYASQMSEQERLYSFSAMQQADGRVNYWKQEVGTSMSSPFVAGSIALWLEANPQLTVDSVKAIIARTSTVDAQVLAADDPVRWGAGKFNAIAGLKEAIRMSNGVQGTLTDGHNDRLIVTPGGRGRYTIFLGDARRLDIEVYTMDGRRVMTHAASGDETLLDASSLPSGIYIVRVNGRHSHKITI